MDTITEASLPAHAPLSSAALREHLQLQWRLLQFLRRRAPWITLLSTLARVGSDFSQLFAFFIPIKIIILMGSDGVPKYLAGLMTADSRNAWIVGLSLLTVLLYALAIGLMIVARHLSSRAAARLADAPPAGNASTQPFRRVYTIACRAYANLLIVGIGILALLAVHPQIFAAAAGLLVIEFLLTQRLLASANSQLVRLGGLVRNNAGLYLRYLGNLNFLAVFAVLLAEYAVTGQINTLTAILALLLARRTFQSAAALAQRALALQRKHGELQTILAL